MPLTQETLFYQRPWNKTRLKNVLAYKKGKIKFYTNIHSPYIFLYADFSYILNVSFFPTMPSFFFCPISLPKSFSSESFSPLWAQLSSLCHVFPQSMVSSFCSSSLQQQHQWAGTQTNSAFWKMLPWEVLHSSWRLSKSLLVKQRKFIKFTAAQIWQDFGSVSIGKSYIKSTSGFSLQDGE